MATRYWVGGTGTWDTSTTTNWSATSGGGGGASVPGILDNVIIDNNSGTGTITCSFGECLDLTVTATQAIILGAAGNLLSAHGNVTFPSSGSFSASANTWTLILRATLGNSTITTNGKRLSRLTIFSSAGNSVVLGDNFAANSSLSLTGGGFNTNNYTVDCGFFSYTYSGSPSSINLGTSTFNVTGSNFTIIDTTGLTFTPGTSTVFMKGNFAIVQVVSGISFYNLTFINSAGFGSQGITSANGLTINNNLTFYGPTAGGFSILNVDVPSSSNPVYVFGAFNILNTTPTRRAFIKGTNVGIQAYIQAAATSFADTDFEDIVLTGSGAPYSGTRLGDCKGNSGITFDTPKTVYWNLAGSQIWSATGWATSSGGTPAVNNFPLAQDTAVFDDTGAADAVNITEGWNIGTIDASSRTLAFTLTESNPPFSLYGNIIAGSGFTFNNFLSSTFIVAGRNTQTITSNGRSFAVSLTLESPGGTLTFADDFTLTRPVGSTNYLGLACGTINANNKNLTIPSFTTISSFQAKTVTMGSGTWALTASGNVWDATTRGSSLTVNANTSTIDIANTTASATRSFNGATKTYNNINIGGGAATGQLTGLNDTNTFNTLSSTKTVAHTIRFSANQTFANWTANGTAGNLITLDASPSGLRRTITKTGGGTVAISYIRVQDSNGQPAATWSAPVGSVNLGNNSNWTFNAFADAVTENVTYADSATGNLNFSVVVSEALTLADNINSLRTAITSISEAISSCSDTPSALAAFITAVSEGFRANDINDKDFASYAEVTESITLADIEAAARTHNATAVEPVNVADVAECFGFGTIDNTQDVVWVQVDNRQ
jgi:hypothetical protein